ncbi:MAG: hypothetical protein WC139_07195 [Candidatus Kapaibacterium sp.]
MDKTNDRWVRVLLPEKLHQDVKILTITEKKPNGEKKRLDEVIIELLETGLKSKAA